MKKNKHMTFEDRLEIQLCLDRGMTFKAIAARIGKDPTTVSKEVKKNLTTKYSDSLVRYSDTGEVIPPTPCPELLIVPFVCNSCKKKRQQCSYQKQLYYAKDAHNKYKSLLSESREGIALNKTEFYEADEIISAGIKKGQHLYHILKSNDLGISISTAYRHLHKGYLSASKTDFPRVVKFKKRRNHRADYVPKAVKVGRTYEDFQTHIQEHDIRTWVEMDTVIGRIGGKAIMTFDFTLCNFMFGLLLDSKSAAEAAKKIRSLKARLVENGSRFGDIFPTLLTDNGGEFANVSAFTTDNNNEIESDLFFCDPYRSSQKPYVEKNHTMFRDIVPKGKSFDHFKQSTVNLIFSHINSVKRNSLNGKTPYEVFAFTYEEKIASLLGIKSILPSEVIQSPALLQKD